VFLVGFVSSLLVVGGVVAQSPQGTRGDQDGRSAGRNPDFLLRSLPVLIALDSNADGVISKSEIENATNSLQAIDKNMDGELTSDELRPDFSAIRRRSTETPGRGGLGVSPDDGPQESGSGTPKPGTLNRGRENEMIERLMKMDEDKDDKLSREEVPERLRGFFGRADQNDDGYATREELGVAAARVARSSGSSAAAMRGETGERGQQRDPREAFARMFEERDANKDGKLGADEMPEQMAGRLQQIDSDKDGFVSRKEMEAMMARFGNRRGGQRTRSAENPGFGAEGSGSKRAGGEVPRRPAAE
jgi:Ca2+-binding EF-hand superfamily protein